MKLILSWFNLLFKMTQVFAIVVFTLVITQAINH